MRLLKKTIKYFLLLSAIFIVWLELLLRIKGTYYTYTETVEGRYVTYYNARIKGLYHVWPPNQLISIQRSEFSYPYMANSLGLREVELTTMQTDSCRIIFLGDSFTEGVGTPYDSSYPQLLGNRLKALYTPRLQIINAGISGSDPFYCYKLFEDKLLQYHPSLVIIAINSDDLNDYIYRGGMERFHADGTVHFRKGPWWEQLYRFSHAMRYYVHTVLQYNAAFIKQHDVQRMYGEAKTAILQCLMDFNKLCRKNGIEFLVVVHPFPNELKSASSALRDFRLMALKLDSLGVPNADIYVQMKTYLADENPAEYYWQKDTHYNSKGYALFAKAAGECIEQKYPGLLEKITETCK